MEDGLGSGRDRDAKKPSPSAHRCHCPLSLHHRICCARCPTDRQTQPSAPPSPARPAPSPPLWQGNVQDFHIPRRFHPLLAAVNTAVATGGQRPTSASPCAKDDLLLSLNVDLGRVWLEVHLNKEMAPPKGGLRCNMLAAEMEMLGMGIDRLIRRGCIDLTPLLLGMWEEVWVWENDSKQREDGGNGH